MNEILLPILLFVITYCTFSSIIKVKQSQPKLYQRHSFEQSQQAQQPKQPAQKAQQLLQPPQPVQKAQLTLVKTLPICSVNFDQMSIRELRKYAKINQIKGYSKYTKKSAICAYLKAKTQQQPLQAQPKEFSA